MGSQRDAELMSEDGIDADRPREEVGQKVYMVPQNSIRSSDNEISLAELWNILWSGKWLGIVITGLVALLSVVYALLATEWYRADVLLAPADERSSEGLRGTLGGLAGFAGISVGGGGNDRAIAILKSREFLASYISEKALMPVLFAEQWDAARGVWITDAEEEMPDIRDAVKYFQENVLRVHEDSESQLVTVTVEWTDPHLAAEWAQELVVRLNDRMRQRSLIDAERNVAYLREQLGAANLMTLRQSVGRLLETELQKLMLARGNDEFAFKVLDPAQIPKRRARPNRTLVVALAVVLGGILSVLAILLRHALRSNPEEGA